MLFGISPRGLDFHLSDRKKKEEKDWRLRGSLPSQKCHFFLFYLLKVYDESFS